MYKLQNNYKNQKNTIAIEIERIMSLDCDRGTKTGYLVELHDQLGRDTRQRGGLIRGVGKACHDGRVQLQGLIFEGGVL